MKVSNSGEITQSNSQKVMKAFLLIYSTRFYQNEKIFTIPYNILHLISEVNY